MIDQPSRLRDDRRPRLAAWILLLALASRPDPARGDLITKTGAAKPTRLEEGSIGLVEFVVMNTGFDPVRVKGTKAAALNFGPDRSDRVAKLALVGDTNPTIDPGDTHTFKYAVYTDHDLNEIDDDFGLVGITFSLRGEDTITHHFVKSKGGTASLTVFDPPPPPPPPPPTAPEPATLTLAGLGAALLSIRALRRGGHGKHE
ncbi:MAG TPA: PEP-CTERM sorting domain-containing protein [Isosphaeraceae bacterium]|jgi:hypothetical protein|nr:PEP-CTERM sorting domain-containing protein [Isosphaeraceae bacterium]